MRGVVMGMLKQYTKIGILGVAIAITPCLGVANIATTYQKTCGACHDDGALHAPKKGDKARWQTLIAKKGMENLIKSTKQGMPQMPAMGLCQTCSDQEFRELIDYMSK